MSLLTDPASPIRPVVVHASADFTVRYPDSGIWKDVKATELLLSELPVSTVRVIFSGDDPLELLPRIPDNATDVLIEYSWWPELVRAIKQRIPTARVHIRTINAEAWQFRDQNQFGWLPTYRNLRGWYGMARLHRRDAEVRCLADTLLGISAWDDEHYWRRFPGPDNVVSMPYFCPWPELYGKTPRPDYDSRSNAVLSLPAGNNNPIASSMLDNFHEFRRRAAGFPEGADLRFQITAGRMGNRSARDSVGCIVLEEPIHVWETLLNVKAVAVLGTRGYGSKTTIFDGLAAGCHVIVHELLAARLEPDVRAACLVCDPGSDSSVGAVLNALKTAPVTGLSVNTRLRRRALDALSQRLNVGPRPPALVASGL
jgi:hypothetical protein